MNNLYVIRHGQSIWNEKRMWAGGNADIPLTDTGRRQARDACAELMTYDFDFTCSSCLLKASETASIIANILKIKLLPPVPEFNERDFGKLSGMTSPEIIEKYPAFYEAWKSGKPSEIPGGESWKEYTERVSRGLAYLSGIPGNGLVIAHMGVLRAVEYLLGQTQSRHDNLQGIWINAGEVKSLTNAGILK